MVGDLDIGIQKNHCLILFNQHHGQWQKAVRKWKLGSMPRLNTAANSRCLAAAARCIFLDKSCKITWSKSNQSEESLCHLSCTSRDMIAAPNIYSLHNRYILYMILLISNNLVINIFIAYSYKETAEIVLFGWEKSGTKERK